MIKKQEATIEELEIQIKTRQEKITQMNINH